MSPYRSEILDAVARQRNRPARLLHAYGLALLIFGAGVLLRVVLDNLVPGQLPFITFFPAVLLATFYGGLGAGLLVLVLSAFVGTYWADPTGGSSTVYYVFKFLLFVVLAGLSVIPVHFLMQALARLKQQDDQLGVINRELKHRIKNLFSIANSVCQQTIKSGKPLDEMPNAISGRLLAIASAQDLLSATALSGAQVDELVGALVATLAPDPTRLKAEGAAVTLSAQATTPFALILHELGTNALKYGAWSHDTGHVKTSWEVRQEILYFQWREHDGPAIAPPLHAGLGSTLIKNSLPGAIVSHDLKADGLECTIQLPLENE
ncbi:MAG: sensor histidine kinase [Methyloceanibacter sp.]|uniref:sensor histidine kinase n=1 Tax=Methyloceanibacter sp. TaxID=1965321 RepID=UPI003D9B295A